MIWLTVTNQQPKRVGNAICIDNYRCWINNRMLSKLNEVDRVTIMHLNSFCIGVPTVWSFLKISMRFCELFSKDTGYMSLYDMIQHIKYFWKSSKIKDMHMQVIVNHYNTLQEWLTVNQSILMSSSILHYSTLFIIELYFKLRSIKLSIHFILK